MRFIPILSLVLVLIAGCSSVQTKVDPRFDWGAVSTVALEAPENDPWEVVPLVREELRALGYAIVSKGDPGVQARVRFFFVEAPDLNEGSKIISRLKGLHLRFFDPASSALVVSADYFPRSSETPKEAVKALFAGLQERQEGNYKNPDPAAPPVVSVESSILEEEKDPPPVSPWVPRLKSWGFEEWGK